MRILVVSSQGHNTEKDVPESRVKTFLPRIIQGCIQVVSPMKERTVNVVW